MQWHLIQDTANEYLVLATDKHNITSKWVSKPESTRGWHNTLNSLLNGVFIDDDQPEDLHEWIERSDDTFTLLISFKTDMHPITYLQQHHIELFI